MQAHVSAEGTHIDGDACSQPLPQMGADSRQAEKFHFSCQLKKEAPLELSEAPEPKVEDFRS